MRNGEEKEVIKIGEKDEIFISVNLSIVREGEKRGTVIERFIDNCPVMLEDLEEILEIVKYDDRGSYQLRAYSLNDKFYDLGFNMAAGKAGTGWMIVGEKELEKYKGMLYEEIFADVEKWTETDQWNYEVGKLILQERIEDDDGERFIELREAWINGYVDYIESKE